MLNLISRDHLNRPSKFVLVILEIGCDLLPCPTSDANADCLELIFLPWHRFCKCLRDRRTMRPNERGQFHDKKAAEYKRVQILGNQTHFSRLHLSPFAECCCRNQMSVHPDDENRASLSHGWQSILWPL